MACPHCTGLGTGQGTGNDEFLYYTMYCTHYTGTGQGHITIVFYCAHPGPGRKATKAITTDKIDTFAI